MRRPTLEELIRLPEEAAVQAYFDGENTSLLRRLMVVLAAGAVVGVIGFLGSGRYGIENLANLDHIPAKGARAFVGPVPWEEGSGSPCRVLATVAGRR